MAVQLKSAMVFAAGLGTRMRPLTDRLPKPLIEIAGRSMLDRALDALARAGIERAVVNSHYLPDAIHAAMQRRRREGRGPQVVLSHEPELLETGGGIVRALRLLGPEPFLSVNGDVIWLDGHGGPGAIARLSQRFDPAKHDALLLLHERERAVGYAGEGDFALGDQGQLLRSAAAPRPLVFTGLQVWHPRVFAGLPQRPFSLGEIYWSRRADDGSLRGLAGLLHDGHWLHVGTPGDIAPTEQYLSVHEQDATAQQ